MTKKKFKNQKCTKNQFISMNSVEKKCILIYPRQRPIFFPRCDAFIQKLKGIESETTKNKQATHTTPMEQHTSQVTWSSMLGPCIRHPTLFIVTQFSSVFSLFTFRYSVYPLRRNRKIPRNKKKRVYINSPTGLPTVCAV